MRTVCRDLDQQIGLQLVSQHRKIDSTTFRAKGRAIRLGLGLSPERLDRF